MARPHIEPFCDRDVQFKNMNLPGLFSATAATAGRRATPGPSWS